MRLRLLAPVLTSLVLATACGGDDDGSGGDVVDADLTADGAPRIDAAPPTDARPADLTCRNDALPDADENVTVSGIVFSGLEQDPVDDAVVSAYPIGSDPAVDDPLATFTTNADGEYSLTAPTGGEPLDAFLYAVKESGSFYPTRLYPPFPVATSQSDVPLPLVDEQLLGLLVTFGGGDNLESGNGIIVGVVVDCAGEPAAGATVTTSPAAGKTLYGNEMGIPSQARTTTSNSGLVFLLNVPEGDVTISATVSGQELRSHVVGVVGTENANDYDGEITATAISPLAADVE